MAVSGDHVVRVDEIPGPRWDLAFAKLDTGGAMTVLDGDPPIGLQRYCGWPAADGQVHISIFTKLEPSTVTKVIAERDAKAALQTLTNAVTADPRLADLFLRHGLVCEYVYDYGHGAAKIGDVAEDGSVTLL